MWLLRLGGADLSRLTTEKNAALPYPRPRVRTLDSTECSLRGGVAPPPNGLGRPARPGLVSHETDDRELARSVEDPRKGVEAARARFSSSRGKS